MMPLTKQQIEKWRSNHAHRIWWRINMGRMYRLYLDLNHKGG